MRSLARALVLVLVAACGSVAQAQSLPINHVEINVYTGDSIAGGSFPFWTVYQADTSKHATVTATSTSATLGATSTAATLGVTSTSATLSGKAYTSTSQAFSNSGLNIEQIRQQQSVWLVAGVAAGATIYYVEAGVNNVFGANKDIPGAQASSLQLIADIHAAAPSAKVAWLNVFAGGSEQIPAATDSDVATVNGYIAAAVSANSSFAYLIDVHTAQQAYETAHNTPLPGATTGVLTLDGTHPNATGQVFFATTMEASISYQP